MITKEEYDKLINRPETYNSTQECIDGIYPIIEYYLKHSNITISNGIQHLNSSQIIVNKPDINDEKNVFAMFMLYNKLIGEPVSQMIINK